jgi:hypothetical protein
MKILCSFLMLIMSRCGQQRTYCSSYHDIWARRSMAEWYRQGTTPDSSTRALWQSYEQSSSTKASQTGEENDAFWLRTCLCSYFEDFFNIP